MQRAAGACRRWQTYIKGRPAAAAPARGGEWQFSALPGIEEQPSPADPGGFIQEGMSGSGALQLPQAQRRNTSVELPSQNQKPLSLPSQAGGAGEKDSKEVDDKAAVKVPPSIPAPVTEQTLASVHGIVPTLQYV